MIHRNYFFENIKYYLFKSMNQDQVDGCNVFLDWYDLENPSIPSEHHFDDRMLAYVLATAYHETAATMQPIEEYGKGSGSSYGKPAGPYGQCYYGRGYVQLTWYDNYLTQDDKLELHEQLVKDADLALAPNIAKKIILFGMADGDFTGKGLGEFFTGDKTDWYNARTIVNGHDRADDIAAYAEQFHNAIGHT
jgi:putative chitinase